MQQRIPILYHHSTYAASQREAYSIWRGYIRSGVRQGYRGRWFIERVILEHLISFGFCSLMKPREPEATVVIADCGTL